MPDLGDLLASAATEFQPVRQPEFGQLVRASRRRRQRRVTGSAAAVVVLALSANAVTWRPGPVPQEPSGRVPQVAVEVTGSMRRIGGPMGAAPLGVGGTVRFEDAGGTTVTAEVAADGRFTVAVPAGRYVVTGTPAGAGQASCRATAPVVVADTRLDGIEVDCHVR
ncbi:hypothetical protein Aph02nite_23700 [Actinoplanes philippinensis]|uniref:Carboxypeptidase regulatory-like domain-containing protein n=1 Tax=Actinoplanes philippinensis TaxID=35752 RepID=A0A1I2FZ20_9ACTN|nr:hypothetical protein [Actinoplanes philippinensis]GIE76420.1 hypothetical protein Aph02nite_23700 [Actinoplanes philippinensis]SFF10059.1 hypothetical protein SAMN05421541_10630 [Actinoplanes philippinensis]